MPGVVRYAVASAAHNLASTWNGGASVPSAGDTVYMNGFTVTGYAADFDLTTGAPDVNAGSFVTGVFYVIKTVGSTTWTAIGSNDNNAGTGFFATGAGSGSGVATAVGCITNRSLASPAIVANGSFSPGDGRTLKATVYGTNTGNAFTVQYTGYTSTTIVGDVYPAFVTGNVGAVRLLGGIGTLILNGNVKQQQSVLTVGGVGVYCGVAGPSLILNGNIEAPTGTSGTGVYMAAGFNCTINGTITGGTSSGGTAASLSVSGNVNIMGPLSGGSPTAPVITGGSNTTAFAVLLTGTACTATVTIGSAILPGTITGGSVSSANGLATSINATSDITVWANLIGGTAAAAISITTSAKFNLNGNVTAVGGAGLNLGILGVPSVINGDVTGSSTAAQPGLSLNNGANVTVNGNVTGGSFAGSLGVNDTASWYCKVNGDVRPGAGSASHCIQVAGSSTVYVVNGTCYASNATSGSSSYGLFLSAGSAAFVDKAVGCNFGPSNTSIIINYAVINSANIGSRIYIRKTQQGTGGFPAVSGNIYRWADNTTYTDEDVLYTSGGSNYATLKHRFGNSAYIPPTADKTRSGTVFAFGDMTGTMPVPSSNSVRAGVSLDATTGVAVMSATDVWKLSNTTTASSGGLLELIKSASTVEIAAATTTSFEP